MRIRSATKKDVDGIMKFIDKYWKKDHILAKDKKFFEWMYVKYEECYFTIAEDEDTEELYGIHAYIPYCYEKPFDAGSSIWKVRKSDIPMLGMELTKYERENAGYREYIMIGMNKRAAKICELMGCRITELEPYYILGDFEEYKIAKITNNIHCELPSTNAELIELTNIKDFEEVFANHHEDFVHKSSKYLKHRYFEHPIYRYQCFAIKKNDQKTESMFFGREVSYAGRTVFKIVDFIGDKHDIALIGEPLRQWIRENQYEYVDFYSFGIEYEIMTAAGFIYRSKDDPNILPNYFEPFEQTNVEIRIAVPYRPGILVFRGDGDMDRPSKR